MLDNSFYRLRYSKIFTPPPPHLSQLIPSHIKLNACSFTDENVSRFSEITQIRMCLPSINDEDEKYPVLPECSIIIEVARN